MMANDRSTEFKELLLHLSENMSDADLTNLKFRYNSQISRSRMERIKLPIELFDELLSRRIISVDKTDELKKIVKTCMDRKEQFINDITRFEQSEFTRENITRSSSVNTTPLKAEIGLLVNKLGSNWKFFFRQLDIPEEEIDYQENQYPRNIKEVIHGCLRYWLLNVACEKTEEEIRQAWLKSLKDLERNALAQELEAVKNQA